MRNQIYTTTKKYEFGNIRETIMRKMLIIFEWILFIYMDLMFKLKKGIEKKKTT